MVVAGRGNAGENGIITAKRTSGKAFSQKYFTSGAGMACGLPRFLV